MPSRNNKTRSRFSEKRGKNIPKIKGKLTNIFVIMLMVGLLTATVIGAYLGYNKIHSKFVAVQAVNDMFTFSNYKQLHDTNMPELQSITTQDTYNKVTFTNVSTALNSYLPFFGHATKADIIDVTSDYVLFKVYNPSIKLSSIYMMFYKTNIRGKLDYIQVYHGTEVFK